MMMMMMMMMMIIIIIILIIINNNNNSVIIVIVLSIKLIFHSCLACHSLVSFLSRLLFESESSRQNNVNKNIIIHI